MGPSVLYFFTKELAPFLGLTGATYFVYKVNARILSSGKEDKEFEDLTRIRGACRQKAKYFALAYIAFVFVFVMITLTKFPGMLQDTNGEVTKAKELARMNCKRALDNFDYALAEAAIRNNSIGASFHHKLRSTQRLSLDVLLQRICEVLFFQIGTLFSTVPFFIAVVIYLTDAHTLFGKIELTVPTVGDVVVILPIINLSLAQAWVAFAAYSLWLRDMQTRRCILLSGHWYTFGHTVLAFLVICCYLLIVQHADLSSRRTWITSSFSSFYWYIVYCVIYIAISLRILGASMEFYHDIVEANEGIKSCLLVSPLASFTGMLILYRSISWSKEHDNRDVGNVSPLLTVKVGENYRMAESHFGETASEISVKKDQSVKVLEEPKNGWVYVQRDNDFGFVPLTYLAQVERRPTAEIQSTNEFQQIPNVQRDVRPHSHGSKDMKVMVKMAQPKRSAPLLEEIKAGVALRKIKDGKGPINVSAENDLLSTIRRHAAARNLAVEEEVEDDDGDWTS